MIYALLLVAVLFITPGQFQYEDYYPEGYNTNYDNDDWDRNPWEEKKVKIWTFLGRNIGFWIPYGIIFFFGAFLPGCFLLFVIFIYLSKKDYDVYEKVWSGFECIFCAMAFTKKEKDLQWREHRAECFNKYKEVFQSWKSPYNVECPKCNNEQLRLVPSNEHVFCHGIRCERRFKCKGVQKKKDGDKNIDYEECPYQYLRNFGNNRFTCYACDFNICRTCLRKSEGVYVHPRDAMAHLA